MELPEIPEHNHPRRSIYVPGGIYFITTVVRGRTAFFADWKLRYIFLKSLAQGAVLKDFYVLALALMPDHVHLILKIGEFTNSKIMHSVKKHVSREINKRPDIDIFRWQQSFRDHLIRGKKDFAGYFYYTIRNPLNHKTDGFVWSVARKPDEAMNVPENEDSRRKIRGLLETALAHRKSPSANAAIIAAADNEIDELIYELYSLTDGEIAIVEGEG